MTLDQAGTEGIVHWDVTRAALIDALANHPLGAYLHLEARGRMADALLVQMPVASGAGFYMEGVKAERERIAELAERHQVRGSCEDCAKVGKSCGLGAPFADLIRQEPQP